MTIQSYVRFDNATGEREATYTLEPDRRWLGFPMYAIGGLRLDSTLPVLTQLGLVIVDHDFMAMVDWAMHRGLGARLYGARRQLHYGYLRLLRQLYAWHLVEPTPPYVFSWRRNTRPLGPWRHWRIRRRATAQANRERDELIRWTRHPAGVDD